MKFLDYEPQHQPGSRESGFSYTFIIASSIGWVFTMAGDQLFNTRLLHTVHEFGESVASGLAIPVCGIVMECIQGRRFPKPMPTRIWQRDGFSVMKIRRRLVDAQMRLAVTYVPIKLS